MDDVLKANGLEVITPIDVTSGNGGAHVVGLPGINRPYRGCKPLWASLLEVPGGIDNPIRQPLVAGAIVVCWIN